MYPTPDATALPQLLADVAVQLSGGDQSLDWQAEAACAETDPEIFYPEKGRTSERAKRICGGCAVQPECLAHALRTRQAFGIWGGLSERERRGLSPNRAVA